MGSEEQPTGEQDMADRGDQVTKKDQSPEQQLLPKDVVFGLLSTKRRRDVLEYMVENGPETTLSDLAEHIAAEEKNTEIRLLSSQQRKRVYVALYQGHLPKMDDADVIDFDHARGTVELRPNAAELYHYLEVSPDSGGTGSENEQSITGRVTTVRSKIEELIPKSA